MEEGGVAPFSIKEVQMKSLARLRLPFRRAALPLLALSLMLPVILINFNSALANVVPTQTETRSVIPGHLIPVLKNHSPLHVSASSGSMQISVALNLRNEDKLNQLLKDQNNPLSPFYHRYLTPAEFTQLFGPTTESVSQVVDYLSGQGLHVSSISSNNTLISASGTVAAVEQAFATSLSDYTFQGRNVHAPTVEPSVPPRLAGLILNVSGLDNVARYQPASKLVPATGPGGGYTPSELRTAYDANSLISTADGTGQTVAIFELDGYKPADITSYLSNYSLGAAKFSNVLVDGATNTAGAGAIEVELDMEIVSALAPGANQKIYIGPNSTAGVNDTYNRIVTDNVAKVTSTSWGLCESSSGTAELTALHNIFAQGTVQGQSFFSASGDAGAYDCGSTTLGVDSPSGDPSVVGVGGTALTVGTGGTYVSEKVWSDPTDTRQFAKGVGGGGGYSSFFNKPTYQTGTGVDTNTHRHVPDVSADADPSTGYSVFCTATASGCSSASPWIVVGGTSAAAPLWAAIATDTNQYLAGLGKPTLGGANAILYTLFNTAQTFPAYHDVTTGNNLFYNATAGYDLASGIGTPDVWNLARDAANVGGGTPTPTPTPGTTPTPTPTSTPGGGTTSQLLLNPGFESGGTSWVESSSGGFEIVDPANPHTGTRSAWLCGYNSCSDSILQGVTLPATTTHVTLSFWLFISTSETSTTCFDHFFARVRNNSGTILSTVQSKCNSNVGWTQYTFDVTSALSGSHGQIVQVFFAATTDSSLVTNFFVDDVALNVTF